MCFHYIRTNNDVEGWYYKRNYRGHPEAQLYLLESLLHKEASYTTNQVRLVSDGKLNRMQKKIYRDMQAMIFNYCEHGERNSTTFLRACFYLVSLVQLVYICNIWFQLYYYQYFSLPTNTGIRSSPMGQSNMGIIIIFDNNIYLPKCKTKMTEVVEQILGQFIGTNQLYVTPDYC